MLLPKTLHSKLPKSLHFKLPLTKKLEYLYFSERTTWENLFSSASGHRIETLSFLYNRLQDEGIQVFMSSENLEDDDIRASRLAQEMKASDLMLAFITEAYLSQQFQVDKEWYLANELQKPTLPVLYTA